MKTWDKDSFDAMLSAIAQIWNREVTVVPIWQFDRVKYVASRIGIPVEGM